MQYLSSGPEDELNHRLVRAEDLHFPDPPRQPYPAVDGVAEEPSSFQIGRLLRKYWLLLLALMLLGAAGGFVSVILSAPMYRSQLMLEVQSSNGLLRPGEGGNAETSEIDIQTQVQILHSGHFLNLGADRVQADSAPLTPTGRDIFSRLRQRIHPATQNPLEANKTGLAVAVASFDARPINRTRLIQLTTQSTSPDVAAQFLNAMAEIFKEDSTHSRSTTARATGDWLALQIEDANSRVNQAEEKLRDFSQANGNLFAGDTTLDDTKLAQLKGELAKIQSVRINRQTRFDLTQKYPPEQLAEVLDDGVLRGYQQEIERLKREKAMLLTTLTEKHEKVQKVDAQLEVLQKSYAAEISSVLTRIKHDFEASLKEETALTAAYAGQSQRVGSEAGKAAQYQAYKREAETQRQTYQSLLMQQNQTSLSSSVPITPIRVVEPAVAAETPYKPQPTLNISFGTMFGLAFAAGLIFLRERMDRSIKVPGMTHRLFNAPELGVIPNLGNGNGAKRGWLGAKNVNGTHEDPNTALVAPASAPTFVTESFRSTLASILRNQGSGKAQKVILVTSPGPSEGKTTVVQNLGIVLAESGRKVLLVDADFRRPHLHRKFGLANEWGLIDVLCEDLPLSEYPLERLAVPTGLPGLAILPNRVTQNNVAKALYSPRFRAVLQNLSRQYDMILVDAPPILSVADARIIAPLTDSLILVLRCGVTDRESAMEAYQRIQADGVSLLGTVLTDYDLSGDRRRQYYYDYGDASRV
jgi:capsular exopolysaccharide synthesis family protein